jgi:cell division protein FtsA
VLSNDERELGVAIVNIGGGTTDIAIIREGAVMHTSVIPVGGQHITNDIAVGLRTPQHDAEKIKVTHGSALAESISMDDTIEVSGVGGRKQRVLSRRLLAEIIAPRVEEIFVLVQQELTKSGFGDMLSAGIVLTGGTAQLDGIVEVAENIFELPVKRGVPQDIGGLRDVVHSPQYATGVGLLKYGAKNLMKSKFPMLDNQIYMKVKTSMKAWIKDLF